MPQAQVTVHIGLIRPADRRIAGSLLAEAGIEHSICSSLTDVLERAAGGAGVLIVEEELLSPAAVSLLNRFLSAQPSWSNVPVILLRRRMHLPARRPGGWIGLLPGFTVVERPVASQSLISLISTMLQARRRQYEVRDLLGNLRELNQSLEQRVTERTADLARSNKELEQFAYVAGHDLQEPLRMVNAYLKLLADKYKPQLDAKAGEYIGFAVDGATRMSQLIRDLLEYSRAGRVAKELVPTNAGAALTAALANLRTSIQKADAVVTHDELPMVLGDPTQLTRLFQNLVGNAIKFRSPDRPCQIHVGVQREGAQWVFQVRDNGIGIPKEAFDRVFEIFQRLHTRDKYAGTGIGLAVCKKIVEIHGGRIWVESEPGKGSAFCFTLSGA